MARNMWQFFALFAEHEVLVAGFLGVGFGGKVGEIKFDEGLGGHHLWGVPLAGHPTTQGQVTRQPHAVQLLQEEQYEVKVCNTITV